MKKHYIREHKINLKNYFFKALFENYDEVFLLKKCYRCDEFIMSCSHEIQHNFINHYQKGGEIPFENRPFQKTSVGFITRFSISYDDHKNSYDFADPVNLLENFFDLIDVNFVTDGKKHFIVKSSFSIQNYQPPPEDMNNVRGLMTTGYGALPPMKVIFLMTSLSLL